MAKDYQHATPEEKFLSATKYDQDSSQPGTLEMLGNLMSHAGLGHLIPGRSDNPHKEVSVQKTTISASPNAMPEDIRNTLQDIQNQKAYERYEKSRGLKKGGKVNLKNKFVDHSDHVKKHSSGFKHHDDHVKSMCNGGKTK